MRRWAAGLLEALARRATKEDGSIDRAFLLNIFIATYAVFIVTYLAINEFSVGRRAWTLFLPGEQRIPLVPELELVYASGYLLPALVVFLLPDGRTFARLLLAFSLTLAAAYVTYLLFPVHLERPPLEVDSLPAWLLSLEYRDPSYNHFPSLHVAISWLVYVSCRPGLARSWPLLLWVLAVAASTVFVKQHYIVDVPTGIALAAATWWAVGRMGSPPSTG